MRPNYIDMLISWRVIKVVFILQVFNGWKQAEWTITQITCVEN